ncbi:BMP family lipoprotein [Branchiibius cervicis]|uniref:BMP family protein n=1 Tax=Branchiibius cervicis TaxID=908252 RepID=A0ABW2AV40_9MICO
MQTLKKIATTSAVAALAIGLAACGSNSTSGSSPSGTGAGSGTGTGGAGQLKVGMAYDVGGRGDHSFNDSAAAGLDEAEKKFGIKPSEIVATSTDNDASRLNRLQQLAQNGNTAIVAVGFSYASAVGKAAQQFPNVKFAIIDDASDASKGTNVDQITFTEEQGSFLAGAAAALKSKSNHIGFVGGVQNPLIQKFQAGYVAGAKYVNKNIKVDVAYLTQPPDFSGFADPAKGKTAAAGMYQNGADIVYGAAGKSGDGVFQAAKAAGTGHWAIGVDSDQALTADASVRDVILTSMVKGVNVGVLDFLTRVHDGTFKGGNTVFALKDGGVSLATTGGHIDDIKSKLDDIKAKIVSGEIKVPTTP